MTRMRVEMPYIGSVITVNHMYHAGRYLKPTAREWRHALTMLIMAETHRRRITWVPPLRVIVNGQFRDGRSVPDLHNLKLVADSVEWATGVNDRDYTMVFEGPQVVKGCEPTIYIMIEDSADAASQSQPEPATGVPRAL